MTKVQKVSKLIPLDDAFRVVEQLERVCVDSSGNIVEFFSSGRRRVSIDFSDSPSLTEQSHKDSCNIDYLVAHHLRMGGIPPMPETQFVDLTQSLGYQDALNKVLQIDSLFESLPLAARDAYGHDPIKFMAAVEDPAERDRMIQLGIFKPKVEVPVEPVKPAGDSST